MGERNYGKALMQLEGLARQFEQLRKRQQVFMMMADAYVKRGQLRLALPHLKILLSYDPARREYWLGLANAYLRLGRLSRAMAVLANARLNGYLVDPEDIYLLASVYQNQGESLKSAELLHSALDAGEVVASTRNLRLLSTAWHDAGDWARVRDLLEQHFVLEMMVDAELVRHLVGVQLEMGDRCDALVSLGWLLDQAADGLGAVLFQTGLVQYQLGRIERAHEALTRALEFPPVAERAKQALEQVDSVLPMQSVVAPFEP
jgi:tetratricopeptide (TPR) repeat protein